MAAIIDAYRAVTQSVTMSGPTLLAPILEKFEKATVSNKVYRLLVIMVDGEIDDYKVSLNILVRLSFLPCSVIIVGIGAAPFTKLSQLNKQPLRDSDFSPSRRATVQFVNSEDGVENALRKIPLQVCEHLEKSGYVPDMGEGERLLL